MRLGSSPDGPQLVWDNHVCMPLRPGDDRFLGRLAEYRAGGVDVVTLNIGYGGQSSAEHMANVAYFREWLLARPDAYILVSTPSEAHLARETGRLGVCFDIEGMTALDGRLDMVSTYYELGVRWMLVAYNSANLAGSGCMDADDGGLTEFGREVIGEMNRVGMVCCGSHTGYRTAQEMIDLSAAPTIFSHSNPRTLCDVRRNIPDSLIRACAARGGVVGVNGVGPFLGANDASVPTLADHIEYLLDLVGEDHVGIGLDCVFDMDELNEAVAANPAMYPPDQGYDDGMKILKPSDLPKIAIELSDRGLRQPTIRKIFGGNWQRIAESVWR